MAPTPIPTNLITGFLGAGKTTAILSLLARKPADEHWAVLVNEFGAVGIDGALLRDRGATVREVPGGCMCCVAGVPMQVGLNLLIAKSRPQRLLIEPTGLGHPARILALLRSEAYGSVLDPRATVCLVDPRKLGDARYRDHVNFRDQANLADVIVGNKADGLDDAALQTFEHWLGTFQPPKAAAGLARFGEFPLDWLDLPLSDGRRAEDARAHEAAAANPWPVLSLGEPSMGLAPQESWRRLEGQGQGMISRGWLFADATRFSLDRLLHLCHGLQVRRLKAVMATDQGWKALNLVDDVLTVTDLEDAADSRFEVILDQGTACTDIERQLLACRDRL